MLATIAQLKAHIGIPVGDNTKDGLLGVILAGASRFFETQTNRRFSVRECTENIREFRGTQILVKNYPLRTVNEIKINDVLLNPDSLQLDSAMGEIYYRGGFFGDVKIVYVAGYDLELESGGNEDLVLPPDIRLAVIRLAARVYERRTAEGVGNASPGSFSVAYNMALDDDIKATINLYRRPAQC